MAFERERTGYEPLAFGRTLKARIEERVRDFEGGQDYWEIFRNAGCEPDTRNPKHEKEPPP